jgi:hypothetical protein
LFRVRVLRADVDLGIYEASLLGFLQEVEAEQAKVAALLAKVAA